MRCVPLDTKYFFACSKRNSLLPKAYAALSLDIVHLAVLPDLEIAPWLI